jgi:hypothetical protein
MLLLCAVGVALVACGDDDSESSATAGSNRTEASREVGCGAEVEPPAPKPDGGAKKPKDELNPAKRYDVTLETSCGGITIRVDQKTSPKTAASFVSLAESGFYDDTLFHRIVPDFVIQGGDPSGSGSGGPGYSVRDVPPPDAAYTEGVVAMAKTAAARHVWQPVLHRHRPGRRAAAGVRAARQGGARAGRGARDRQARRPGERRGGHAAPDGRDRGNEGP